MLGIELPNRGDRLIRKDGFIRMSMDKSFCGKKGGVVGKSVHLFLAGLV
jgi:hypothetical protein